MIGALRSTYPLAKLLGSLRLARSTYFYQRLQQALPDKYTQVRTAIRNIFDENYHYYGYRRIESASRREGRWPKDV